MVTGAARVRKRVLDQTGELSYSKRGRILRACRLISWRSSSKRPWRKKSAKKRRRNAFRKSKIDKKNRPGESKKKAREP